MDDELTIALRRFPLREYAVSFGGDREGRNEYLVPCPKCGTQKLAVNVARARWRCFRCEKYRPIPAGPDGRTQVAEEGAGGVFQLVAWMEGLNPRQTAKRILELARPPAGGALPVMFEPPGAAFIRQPTGLPAECVVIPHQLPYMVRRGITMEDARMFGLGWIPPAPSGWLQNRLVFPVYEGGRCLYWQARACWDKHEHVPRPWRDREGQLHDDKFRKTLNPAAERDGIRYLGSSDVLGNIEQASQYPRVAIVEGPTSGIRTGPSAVWTFGKHLSNAQVAKLIAYKVRRIDFMWDGPSDEEPNGAWPEMIQAAKLLATHADVRLVFLPRGDPGDYPRVELDWYRAHARGFQKDFIP